METKLIFKQMAKILQDISPVMKDQKNESQGFKFRGIDQFVNALHPLLAKHNVFMLPECTTETHELKDVVRANGKQAVDKHVSIQMKYHFVAEDGSEVVAGPIPAEGLDSGDKATNKALSAALKYALIQIFQVPTVDMEEGDKVSPEIGIRASVLPVTSGMDLAVAEDGATSSATISSTSVTKKSFRKPNKTEHPSVITETPIVDVNRHSDGWQN